MGTPKMLLPWGATTVLEKILKLTKSVATDQCYIISGENHNQLQKIAQLHSVHLIKNPNWQRGMGNSLAHGIRAVMNQSSAVLVLLADMPTIELFQLNALIETYTLSKADAVCTQYPKMRGVPAVFRHTLFDQLGSLDGDIGARQLFNLQGIAVATHCVPWDYEDIDTPEAYQKLKNKYRL